MISSDIRRRLLGSQKRLVSLGSQCQRWSLLGLNVNSRLAPLSVYTLSSPGAICAFRVQHPVPRHSLLPHHCALFRIRHLLFSTWISSGLLTSHFIILPALHPLLPPRGDFRVQHPNPRHSLLARHCISFRIRSLLLHFGSDFLGTTHQFFLLEEPL